MRLAALALALALLAPATAGAGSGPSTALRDSLTAPPFGELPFRPVAGVATSVRTTGTPGELTRWSKDGVELLRADANGIAPAAVVRFGRTLSCPVVAGQADGAAVVAAFRGGGMRAAVREPGRGFTAPVTLPLELSRDGEYVVVGAAEQVATWIGSGPFGQGLAAGVDGGGGVTLAWARGATSISLAIETASAAPGEAFGAPSRVATSSYASRRSRSRRTAASCSRTRATGPA